MNLDMISKLRLQPSSVITDKQLLIVVPGENYQIKLFLPKFSSAYKYHLISNFNKGI